MYPSLNHLLNKDEGKYKEIANIERQKIQELLEDGKIKPKSNEILPIKSQKMSNTRTIYEGERNMLNRGLLARLFACK